MNPLLELQTALNTRTRDRWDRFAGHREKVTALLAGAARGGSSRLCVLGAGNCNDLDLPALRTSYREIHLVDLDGGAVAAGLARQGLDGRPDFPIHGGIDVSGVLDALAGWSPATAPEVIDASAIADAPAGRVAPLLPGPFDVVASTCLLTQLIDAVVRTVGERHPRFVPLVQAVRAGHFRLLARLVAPGGTGVLITDVVSSDSCPPLRAVADGELPDLLDRLVRAGNFFHGVNPRVLEAQWRTDPGPAAGVAEAVAPWCWDLGPRVYAVCAFRVSAPKELP